MKPLPYSYCQLNSRVLLLFNWWSLDPWVSWLPAVTHLCGLPSDTGHGLGSHRPQAHKVVMAI